MRAYISWNMWILRILIRKEILISVIAIFNIGTGKEISIATLADLIVRTTGYRGKVEFNPTKPDGTMRKLTDVAKLHELGWHHRVDIEDGVRKMYYWYLSAVIR